METIKNSTIKEVYGYIGEYIYPLKNIYFILLLAFTLFSGYKFFAVDRFVVEALIIMSCLIFFDRFCVLPFLLILGVMVIHSINGNNFYYYDLANIPLILMFTKKIVVNRRQLNNLIVVLILILTFFVFLNEILGLYVDDMRNPGPFASSLHLAYLLICISFALFASNPNFFYSANSLTILLAILSASRAAIIFCYAVYLIRFYKFRKFLPFVFFILICIFYYCYGRRSLGIESGNDDIRMMGYKNFFSAISVDNISFGVGRSEYGSIGIRVHGKENVLITESSLLMLIYTQGVFFALFFIAKLFAIIKKVLSSAPEGYFLLPLWAAIFLLIPFFDSPSISVINLIILKCIESVVRSDD